MFLYSFLNILEFLFFAPEKQLIYSLYLLHPRYWGFFSEKFLTCLRLWGRCIIYYSFCHFVNLRLKIITLGFIDFKLFNGLKLRIIFLKAFIVKARNARDLIIFGVIKWVSLKKFF